LIEFDKTYFKELPSFKKLLFMEVSIVGNIYKFYG
jgi:hypothetical protein